MRSSNCQSLTALPQPIPGHAICNIGDALALLSGGILRSNIHRVVYVFLPLTRWLSRLT